MIMKDYIERQTSEWTTFSGNNSNTFSTRDIIPANLIRSSGYLSNLSSVIAITNGTIYGAGKVQSNTLFAIDIKSNTLKWQYSTGNATDTIKSIIADESSVFLLTASGIISLADTGGNAAVKWTKRDNALSFNYDTSRIFYITTGANAQPSFVILDSSNGNVLNRISIGKASDQIGVIAVGVGRLYFTVWNDISNPFLQLYSLDPIAGRIQWIAGLGSYAVPSSHLPVYSEGRVYLDYEPLSGNIRQHLIAAFDAQIGRRLWVYNIGTAFGHTGSQNRFSVSSDSVITVDNAGYMTSIHKETGALRWSSRYADISPQGVVPQSSGLLIAARDTVIINNNRKVKIISASGTVLSGFNTDNGDMLPVAAAENTLVLAAEKGLAIFVSYVQGTASNKPYMGILSITPARISPYEAGYSQTTIRIALSETENIQMQVINSSGQVIRNYPGATLSYGTGYRTWDGRDDLGKPVPYGKYHFAFNLKDLAGNSAYYEYPSLYVTVGNIIAVALSDVALRTGPGTQYSILRMIPTGANLYILNESGAWLNVSYLSGTPGYVTGYVPTAAMSVYSNPVPVTVVLPVNYTVQSGDSIYTIASKFGTTMQLIIKYNNLTNPNNLKVGQKLMIPTLSKQPVKVIHVVVAGDSLWKISNNYKVLPEILLINNKVNPNNLTIGQKLLIK